MPRGSRGRVEEWIPPLNTRVVYADMWLEAFKKTIHYLEKDPSLAFRTILLFIDSLIPPIRKHVYGSKEVKRSVEEIEEAERLLMSLPRDSGGHYIVEGLEPEEKELLGKYGVFTMIMGKERYDPVWLDVEKFKLTRELYRLAVDALYKAGVLSYRETIIKAGTVEARPEWLARPKEE